MRILPRKRWLQVKPILPCKLKNKQELLEDGFHKRQPDIEKRLFLLKEMAEHNKQLAVAAKKAGVIQPGKYVVHQNHGYVALYNGLGAKEMRSKKGL